MVAFPGSTWFHCFQRYFRGLLSILHETMAPNPQTLQARDQILALKATVVAHILGSSA
jgi:hypothetical protein